MSTSQSFSVTLSRPAVSGSPARDFGVWAGKTGGESTREVTDYYPGAMLPARKLTGVATTSDLSVTKLEADLTDDAVRVLYADLESDVQYTAVVQRLTAADRTSGAPRAYRCLVTGIAPPDTDAASADAAVIGVTLSVFGLPTIAA